MPESPINPLDAVTVELIDVMGSDVSVARAAWISTGPDEREKDPSNIRGLLKYLMSHRHGCYDDETEVLTSGGWKRFPEVDGTETFVTLDLETQEIKHSLADRVVHAHSDGRMLHIRTQQLDLMVTPDHRILGEARTSAGWGSHLKLFPAHEMLDRSHRLRLGGGVRFGVSVPSQDARLLGMIIADGNVNGRSITFHLKKKRKIDYLSSLTSLTTTTSSDTYVAQPSELIRRLAPETYTAERDRRIPREVLLTWSGESIADLIEGYLQGDGSVSRSGKTTMTTVSRQLADDLQEAALLSGSAFQESAPDTERRGAFGTRTVYRLTAIRSRNASPRVGWTVSDRAEEVRVVPYHGGVHCVTVPEGTLYVRRNGKSVWCGNSPFEHSSITFRVHAPIMVFREWHRHRVQSYNEQCLSGSTIVTRVSERRGRNEVQHKKNSQIAVLWRNWHEGVPDSLGRTRKLKSCRKVWVRSFDEETLEPRTSRVVDIKKNGVKTTWQVLTESGKKIRSTMDHKYLTPDGWRRLHELKVGDHVYRSGQRRKEGEPVIPPRLRQGIQIWTTQMKKLWVPETGAPCYMCSAHLAYEDVELDHVVPVVLDLTRALDPTNIKPVCTTCHRTKTNSEQKYADRSGTGWSVRADRVVSISDPLEEETYDLVLEGPHHNFLGDGIVVHNSGRYTVFTPDFYVPGPHRPLINIGTSARPEMAPASQEVYDLGIERLLASYEESWDAYQFLLNLGWANEMSRLPVPVGMYSSMYATANLRAWLHFLGLRTSEPNAIQKGHPQWEIVQAAKKVEKLLGEHFPLTMGLFDELGRVAP